LPEENGTSGRLISGQGLLPSFQEIPQYLDVFSVTGDGWHMPGGMPASAGTLL